MTETQISKKRALANFMQTIEVAPPVVLVDTPPPVTGRRGKLAVRKVDQSTPAAQGTVDDPVQELASLLLSQSQRVRIHVNGITLELQAGVYFTDGEMPSITLLFWGDTGLDFRPKVSCELVLEVMDTGDKWPVIFLGAYARLGLRGSLVSFTLTHAH